MFTPHTEVFIKITTKMHTLSFLPLSHWSQENSNCEQQSKGNILILPKCMLNRKLDINIECINFSYSIQNISKYSPNMVREYIFHIES